MKYMLIISLVFFFALPAYAMEDHIDAPAPDNKTWVPLSETALRAHNSVEVGLYQKLANAPKICTAAEPKLPSSTPHTLQSNNNHIPRSTSTHTQKHKPELLIPLLNNQHSEQASDEQRAPMIIARCFCCTLQLSNN